MPGSPPSSVTDPGTRPPPSTRSSSPIAVLRGVPASGSMSPISIGVALVGASGTESDGSATSSTRVFHWPHDEHCPAHLGCDAPQSVHTCSIFTLAMGAV